MEETMVGLAFMGQPVLSIEETVKTTSSGQRHVHKKITLTSGIVLFEDVYTDPKPLVKDKEKTGKKSKSKTKGVPPPLPSPSPSSLSTLTRTDGALEKIHLLEDWEANSLRKHISCEEKSKANISSKKKKKTKPESINSKSKSNGPKSDKSPKSKTKKPKSEKKKEEEPSIVTVYPPESVPKIDSKNEQIGVWTFPADSQKTSDTSDWAPKDVLVFPPGCEPEDVIDESLPHGIWTSSNDDTDNQPCTSISVGKLRPKDIYVYPPKVKPSVGKLSENNSSMRHGIWTYLPNALDIKWPPTSKFVKKERIVGKLDASRCELFSNKGDKKPHKLRVYTKSMVKADDFNKCRDDALGSTGSKLPIGVWASPSGSKSLNDSQWAAQDIMVYPPGVKPSEGLDESRPHGVWAYQRASTDRGAHKSNIEINDTTCELRPQDIEVYPPGMAPEGMKVDNGDRHANFGVWTTVPGKLDFTWPPIKPAPVRVARKKPGKLKSWQFPKEHKTDIDAGSPILTPSWMKYAYKPTS